MKSVIGYRSGGLLEGLEREAFVNFVETACLMHDIGNPPFGHFGEAAIQTWFHDNGEAAIKAAVKLTQGDLGSGDPRLLHALGDFKEFDGNPQGLRIVARLQWNTDEFGLNLTKTSLASFLKYIRGAGEDAAGIFAKKAGYFSTEKSIVESIWGEFAYSRPQRFPLAYVMEAADDIAYCVSDLEDSAEKGLVDEAVALKEIEEKFLRIPELANDVARESIKIAIAAMRLRKRVDGTEFTYTDFRTSLNRAIVQYVADRYVENHSKILNGTLEALLPRESAAGAILELLKEFCREHVYCHESIQRTELAGYTAIRGLLDHFGPLLKSSRQRFNAALLNKRKDLDDVPIIVESKLLSLFPEKYKKVYCKYVEKIGGDDSEKFLEWNARAHLIVDFLSGMTDDFAMTTYRTLAGMRL